MRLQYKLKDLRRERNPLQAALIAHLEQEAEVEQQIEEVKAEFLQGKEARKRYKPANRAGAESWEGAGLIKKSAQYDLGELDCLADDLPPRDGAMLRFSVSPREDWNWRDPVGPNFEVLKYAIPAA